MYHLLHHPPNLRRILHGPFLIEPLKPRLRTVSCMSSVHPMVLFVHFIFRCATLCLLCLDLAPLLRNHFRRLQRGESLMVALTTLWGFLDP